MKGLFKPTLFALCFLSSHLYFVNEAFANEAPTSVEVLLNARVMNIESVPELEDVEPPTSVPDNNGETDYSWTNSEELLKKLKINDSITPETTNLLGEQINLDTGTVSFSYTDVSLPGNFDLPVEITRTYKGRQSMLNSELPMGDWDLDIPMITTKVMWASGGHYSAPWDSGLICSNHEKEARTT